MGIVIKSRAELARMQAAGRIVRDVLDAIEAACRPGVTTRELDAIAKAHLARAKAESAFLGYAPRGLPPYPAVICSSVNEVVVHGIPDDRELAEGDVVGIDFACYKDGWCADAARTIAIGVISEPARELLDTTRAALERAIAQCVPGRRLGDVGHAVESLATQARFSVVRGFVGHGIGRRMHEKPDVPNYGSRGAGIELVPGMAIAIEPMVNAGGASVRVRDDGWTVETKDRSLSAHFEHTVAITEDGPRILTRP